MKEKINIFWFRRDLRIYDNHGLFKALISGLPVLPVFIFDPFILDKLNAKDDTRVSFIYREIQEIKAETEKKGSSLKIFFCTPEEAFLSLVKDYTIHSVFANRDYEPYAISRDSQISEILQERGVGFYLFKDHVIHEWNEVLKEDGNPYTVFTPYSKKWKTVRKDHPDEAFPSEQNLDRLININPFGFPTLQDLGFTASIIPLPPCGISANIISAYAKNRDIPSVQGTTRLGIHLRFGTVSVREVVRKAEQLSEIFLNELIWREFFIQILCHFPHVVSRSFKPAYDFIRWRNDEREFEKWCRGETGYPLVDAGMRELSRTGFMHNRVRMVTASFLTKHLLIDWRWGEAWFAEKLLDFELASNNGNWQWAAGCGCDAAPYFRIFNPDSQQKKFDPQLEYIKKWVPEFGTADYPVPMVDHKLARERVLKTYKAALT